ncbi:MAG: hypothetical protein V4681_00105 [Patescibacteria group bacterium]
MKMIAVAIVLAAFAPRSEAAEVLIPSGTSLVLSPRTASPAASGPSAYGVTVYALMGYDASADPPFVLEPTREIPTEAGARIYAEFRLDQGKTVVEYCRAVPSANGSYILPQTRAERLRGGCMVYGYEPPKAPSLEDMLVPVVDRAKATFKPKPKKPVKKKPSRKKAKAKKK